VAEAAQAMTQQSPQEPSAADEKKALRKLLQRKVGRLASLTETEHKKVHGSLNDMFGDTVPTATVETLNKRLETIEGWLRMQ
jgi:hypothetical protein